MDDDKGTTRVLCHSDKGKKFVKEMKEVALCKEVLADKLVAGVKEMYESVSENSKRSQFMNDAKTLSGDVLFDKYYPVTAKVKIKTMVRKTLLITGIYSMAKKCLNRVRGR